MKLDFLSRDAKVREVARRVFLGDLSLLRAREQVIDLISENPTMPRFRWLDLSPCSGWRADKFRVLLKTRECPLFDRLEGEPCLSHCPFLKFEMGEKGCKVWVKGVVRRVAKRAIKQGFVEDVDQQIYYYLRRR